MINKCLQFLGMLFLFIFSVWLFVSSVNGQIKKKKQKEIEIENMDKFDKLAEGLDFRPDTSGRIIGGSLVVAIISLIAIIQFCLKIIL
jgi:hypothetical protein